MKLIVLLALIGVISGVSVEEPGAMYQILKTAPNAAGDAAGDSMEATPVALMTKSQFSSLFGRARRLLQESATTTDESAASSNVTYTYTIVGTVSAAQAGMSEDVLEEIGTEAFARAVAEELAARDAKLAAATSVEVVRRTEPPTAAPPSDTNVTTVSTGSGSDIPANTTLDGDELAFNAAGRLSLAPLVVAASALFWMC